jgi:LuxR family maltose regulon positive regulatory protein
MKPVPPDRLADSLFEAKRTPPQPGLAPVPRDALVASIGRGGPTRLVVLHAPAGFGKTTLMGQLHAGLAEDRRRWLNLDEGDNDAVRLVGHLDRLLGCDDAACPCRHPDQYGAAAQVTHLVGLLARLPEPFALFLDDFEDLDSDAALSLVDRLVTRLPEGKRIVIATRDVAGLKLGRARAGGWLLELDAEALRFNGREMRELLCERHGFALDDHALERLQARTEGWPAALHLAATALGQRRHQEHSAFIDAFTGSSREVAAFLTEDLLNRQPEALREFLLAIGILDRFCPSLCTAVSGVEHAGDLIGRIERASLFVRPLDDHGEWFRFHRLFADFLRGHLKRRDPGRWADLHGRAARWFLAHERFEEALDHALAGGDLDLAADLLEARIQPFVAAGHLVSVVRWAEAMPAGVLEARLPIRLYYAWALAFLWRNAESEAQLDLLLADPRFPTLPAATRDDALQVIPMNAVMTDDFANLGPASRRALEALGPSSDFARGALCNAVAHAHYHASEFQQAQAAVQDAKRCHTRAGSVFGFAYAEMLAGEIERAQGYMQSALVQYRAAFQHAARAEYDHTIIAAITAAHYAAALYELDRRQEARDLLEDYCPVLQENGLPDDIVIGHATLARIHHADGRYAAAITTLNELEALGRRTGLPRLLAAAFQERARLATLRGDLDAAERALADAYQHYPLPDEWRRIPFANDEEPLALTRARLAIHGGRARTALTGLKDLRKRAERHHRHLRALRASVLGALAENALGHTGRAAAALRVAVGQAAKEGYVRLFVDEGEQLHALLRVLRAEPPSGGDPGADETHAYLDRLLAAYGVTPATATAAAPPLAEQLTRRELDVLGLLSDGLANATIADRLHVSLPTVKTHLRNIYDKLGVSRRTEAVARAKRLALID